MGDSPSCATHKALAAAGQSLGDVPRALCKTLTTVLTQGDQNRVLPCLNKLLCGEGT